MRIFTLQGKIGDRIVTYQVKARGPIGAIMEANNTIRINQASERRLAVGDVTLKDDQGNVIWSVIDGVEACHINFPVVPPVECVKRKYTKKNQAIKKK